MIEASEAILWLRVYHADTLRLALECANHASEMARSAHDIYAVSEDRRPVQRERYSQAAKSFEDIRATLRQRADALKN